MELQVDRNQKGSSGEDADFSRPQLVGFFSVKGDGTCTMDSTLLKYWNPRFNPAPHIFLYEVIKLSPQAGVKTPYRTMMRSVNVHKRVLEYAAKYKEKFEVIFNNQPAEDIMRVPVITHQELLRSIAILPYYDSFRYGQRPIKMICYLHRGVIHIVRIYTDLKKVLNWTGVYKHKMLQDRPNAQPLDLDPRAAYVNIYKATLGEHSIIYSAEMDGVEAEDQLENISELPHEEQLSILDKSKFVEIKTKESHIINQYKKREFQRCTTLQYFVHSLFGRIDRLICGFHKWNIVGYSELYDKASLVSESNGRWKMNTCLNTCDTFFTFVKQSFKEEIDKLDVGADDIKKLPTMSMTFEYCRSTNVIKKSPSMVNVDIIPEWLDNFMDETD